VVCGELIVSVGITPIMMAFIFKKNRKEKEKVFMRMWRN
jgi:hypothetical protein